MRKLGVIGFLALALVVSAFATSNESNDTGVCYTHVYDVPVSCTGGSVVSDIKSDDCRTVVCTDGVTSKTVKACPKDGYFEAYNRGPLTTEGDAIVVRFFDVAIGDYGYKMSDPFPLCGTSPPGDGGQCAADLEDAEEELSACVGNLDTLSILVSSLTA